MITMITIMIITIIITLYWGAKPCSLGETHNNKGTQTNTKCNLHNYCCFLLLVFFSCKSNAAYVKENPNLVVSGTIKDTENKDLSMISWQMPNLCTAGYISFYVSDVRIKNFEICNRSRFKQWWHLRVSFNWM